MSDAEKAKKRRKQYKRMEKILGEAWQWDDSFHYSELKDRSDNGDSVSCLHDIGQKLDRSSYKVGRHGWEDFSRDLGIVYHPNR